MGNNASHGDLQRDAVDGLRPGGNKLGDLACAVDTRDCSQIEEANAADVSPHTLYQQRTVVYLCGPLIPRY